MSKVKKRCIFDKRYNCIMGQPIGENCAACSRLPEGAYIVRLYPETLYPGYDSVRELFEDNIYEPPIYESRVSDGTVWEAEEP